MESEMGIKGYVEVVNWNTGEVLFQGRNTITNQHRELYASLLRGDDTALPQYIALGVGPSADGDRPELFTALKAEVQRSNQVTRLKTSPTTVRIAGTFGPGFGVEAIRELGLFSNLETAETVHSCNTATNWRSDAGSAAGTAAQVTVNTTGQVEGLACIAVARSTNDGSLVFRNSNLAVSGDSTDGFERSNPRLQFWYYIDDITKIVTSSMQVVITANSIDYRYSLLSRNPQSGEWVGGWNFFDIALDDFGSGGLTPGTALSAFSLSIDLASTSPAGTTTDERLDHIRLWWPSPSLWAFTTPTPELHKEVNTVMVVYWYLSISGVGTHEIGRIRIGTEEITIGTATEELSESVYGPLGVSPANEAVIYVTSGGLIYRTDGGAPTSARGETANAGSFIILEHFREIAQFQAIRTGAVDAEIAVVYRR